MLPHEEGVAPDWIVADVANLATERPRTLLIIGYSERDEVVVQRLIKPLADRWRVFRVSPNAVGEGAVRLNAGEALSELARMLSPDPDVRGWEFVNFGNQRGIEAAIAGERLGPRDVEALPRLPHFESARRALEVLHSVDVAGHPGSGKSITVWQLARELNTQGWEVLRPDASGDRNLAEVRQAASSVWKRVLVVDDLQTFPATSAGKIAEFAGPTLKVISGTTDAAGEHLRSVRIPAKIAVETIANEFRRRREDVLPIVHRFDRQVGDQYLDIPLERRIDDAAKSDSPWQFAFVLRGGWSQAREQLNALRDFDRADLLLGIIAARQLLSLDAGVDAETICADSQAMGRSEQWARSGLDLLRRHGAILPNDPLRCLHIQAAGVVIEATLKDRREDTFPTVVAGLRRLISDSLQTIRGVGWLLERVLFADAFRYWSREGHRFFEPLALEGVLRRLLGSTDVIDRRDAAFVLSRLLWYGELSRDRLDAEHDILCRWLNSAAGENAYAFGDLVNELREGAKPLAEQVDPKSLWESIVRSRPSDGYAWGHFLSRLSASCTVDWRTRAKGAIPREPLLQLTSGFRISDLYDLSELIEGVGSLDRDVALECMRVATPLMQQAFANDPLDAYTTTSDLHRWVLGLGIFGEQRPSRGQKEISRRIADAIKPARFASDIIARRFGDWETVARLLDWVQKNNSKKHSEIVAAIDWEGLDRRSASFWPSPPREFRLLLSHLTTDEAGNPVRSWVFERNDRIAEIDPILSGISPESAIAVFKRGGRVNLGGHNGSDWRLQMWALARIAEVDPNAARSILIANESHVVGRLSKLQGIDVEELSSFLTLGLELDRATMMRFFGAIDREGAAKHWSRLFKERAEVRRGVRQVLRIISQNSDGSVRELADSLLAKASRGRVSSNAEKSGVLNRRGKQKR